VYPQKKVREQNYQIDCWWRFNRIPRKYLFGSLFGVPCSETNWISYAYTLRSKHIDSKGFAKYKRQRRINIRVFGGVFTGVDRRADLLILCTLYGRSIYGKHILDGEWYSGIFVGTKKTRFAVSSFSSPHTISKCAAICAR